MNIKLHRIKIGYIFTNVFQDIIIFVADIEAEIIVSKSFLDITKIRNVILLYKQEFRANVYMNDKDYYLMSDI